MPSPSPSTAGNVFNAVVAISPNDAWAVGFQGSNNVNESRTLTAHWDGTAWSVVPSPNPGSPPSCNGFNTGNILSGVAAVSSTDVWAVGYYFPCTSLIKPLVLHWNGTAWSVARTPRLLTNDNSALNGVVALASNNVWAVGYQPASNGAVLTLIEHYNGRRWSVVSSPNTSPTGNVLAGISAASPTDLWAVGDSIDAPTTSVQTLAMHYDGAAWTIVPSPNPLPMSFLEQNVLSAVKVVASDDVTAVGHLLDFANQRTVTMIEHWGGATWSVVPSPNASEASGTFNTLNGISGFSSDNLYAVGHFANSSTGGQHLTMIEHWDGATWNIIPSPTTGPLSNCSAPLRCRGRTTCGSWVRRRNSALISSSAFFKSRAPWSCSRRAADRGGLGFVSRDLSLNINRRRPMCSNAAQRTPYNSPSSLRYLPLGRSAPGAYPFEVIRDSVLTSPAP